MAQVLCCFSRNLSSTSQHSPGERITATLTCATSEDVEQPFGPIPIACSNLGEENQWLSTKSAVEEVGPSKHRLRRGLFAPNWSTLGEHNLELAKRKAPAEQTVSGAL